MLTARARARACMPVRVCVCVWWWWWWKGQGGGRGGRVGRGGGFAFYSMTRFLWRIGVHINKTFYFILVNAYRPDSWTIIVILFDLLLGI